MSKTSKVARIIEMANAMMASESPHVSQEWKNGVGFLLSQILHETGNYAGFSYLPSAGVTGAGTPEVAVEREYDRKYHVASKLKN